MTSSNDTACPEMTGAQIVIQALKDNGVEHIFGIPGGAVLPIYDELFQQDVIMISKLFEHMKPRGSLVLFQMSGERNTL